MKLKGKTAAITGAGRGIGRATALELAKEGCNIVLAAPEQDEIERVADEIRALGAEALAVQTDIQFKAQIEAMAQASFDRFGSVEILINNGGVAVHNPIPKIKEEDWDWMMAINLKGTFLCTQAFFQHMCDRQRGLIINVVSRAAKNGSAKMGTYAASKFGALGFTQSTDAEGIPYNVRATAILPGSVATQQRAENHVDDVEKLLQPQDVAEYIAFIATRPDRVHIVEPTLMSQYMKPLPGTSNLKPGI